MSSEACEEYQLHGYRAPSGAHKRKLKGIHTPGIKGPLLAANRRNWSLGCPLPPLVTDMVFLLFCSITPFSEMWEGEPVRSSSPSPPFLSSPCFSQREGWQLVPPHARDRSVLAPRPYRWEQRPGISMNASCRPLRVAKRLHFPLCMRSTPHWCAAATFPQGRALK